MSSLIITQLKHIPLIKQGDNLSEILYQSLIKQNISLNDGDILGITSKIASKAEGRQVDLSEIQPSKKALELGKKTNRDPRLVELVLSESNEVIRATERALIVEHRIGFICANAGVDHSNVQPRKNEDEDCYLLLPEDPDRSARKISADMENFSKKKIGVIIIDSHGRPWRQGTVGVVIGTALVPTLVDLRGKPDIFGYRLKITTIGAADELAAAASLMMGQADEKVPAVHIHGFPYELHDSSINNVLRSKETDLFR